MLDAKPPHLEINESAPIVPGTNAFRAHFTEGPLVGRPIVVKKILIQDLLKVPLASWPLLRDRPIDPVIQEISEPYFILHYQEGDSICYVLHDLGQDLSTFLEGLSTPFSPQTIILLGLICISLLEELAKYHRRGYTIGDLKLENIVVKIGNSATGEPTASVRFINLEWAGKEDRPLTWYTGCHLKVFDDTHRDFQVATKDQDLHALAITIARIARFSTTDFMLGEIDDALDHITPTISRHRYARYIYEAKLASRDLIPSQLDLRIEACGAQTEVFLQCARYLFKGGSHCNLQSCATYLKGEVAKWQELAVAPVPRAVSIAADEFTRLLPPEMTGVSSFSVARLPPPQSTTATEEDSYCSCCCMQ